MRNRAGTLTTVTLFAVAIALLAFVGGRDGGGGGLVKLPVASFTAEAEDAAAAGAVSGRTLVAPAVVGVEYRVAGDLPALPSTAAAYRLRSTATAAEVERLARTLGLGAEVREVAGAWAVRDGDRELRVERVAGLPWYLGTVCEEPSRPDTPVASDAVVTSTGCEVAVSSGAGVVEPAPATAAPAPLCPPGAECAGVASPPGPATVSPCAPDARCVVDPADPGSPIPCDAARCAAPPKPAPPPVAAPEPPARPAGLPSRAEAERIARETFTRLGVALDGFAVEDGWITWEARVEPGLDGIPVTGLNWWLGVGAGGRIAHASGFLAEPEKVGDYPLAGLDVGLRRLNDGFGGGGVPALGPGGTGSDEPVAATIHTEESRVAEERERAGVEATSGSGQSGAPGRSGAAAGAEPAVDLPSPVVDCADPAVPCEPPPDVIPEPVPAPETVVLEVTGARLVLLHLDGLLVPSYVFDLADGGESPPVPAVTDEWLDTEGVARLRNG